MSYKSPPATTLDWGSVRVGSGIDVTNGIISTSAIPGPSLNFGFFYDTTTQTNPVASAVNLVSFNTTGASNQVSVAGSTVTVTNAGSYQKDFTLSFEKTSPGAPTTASIWLRQNGVDVSNSRQDIDVPNQLSLLFVTGVYVISLLAGDTVEMAWSSPDTSVQLSFLAPALAPVRPATPSAKLALTRIS